MSTDQEYPWFKEYDLLGIPRTLKPYPDKPVYDILERAARKYPKMGLVQYGYKITYPEVREQVDRLATALSRMGVEKGDRVATMLPTSIQFVVADYAISRAGLVHIPTSSLEPPDQLLHKFKEGSPRILICLDSYVDVFRQILKETPIKQVLVCSLEDYSDNPAVKHPDLDLPGAAWMIDLISQTSPDPPRVEIDVEKDIETLLFTGGTTGLPKGCMLTHRNIYANSLQNSTSMGTQSKLINGAVSVLLGLPFFHSYGHNVMHTMTLKGFDQLLIPDARDTKNMVEMIREHRPFLQMGVPTQFMKLLEEELEGIFMLGVSGSAPLPPKVQEKFEKKSGGGIMEGYGLSEMSPTTHLNTSFMIRASGGRTRAKISTILYGAPGVSPAINGLFRALGSKNAGRFLGGLLGFMVRQSRKDQEKSIQQKKFDMEKRGTIGIPFPDTEIRIVDVETGRDLSLDEIKAGKTGEMCLSGPQRMLGYWPTPGKGIDERGYIHTGDVVRIDENGYFYIADRTKDMIIVSGYKVYSREVDDILYEHPGVDMAATVGVPDFSREGSERVVVFIQPKPEHRSSLTEQEITDYLRSKVAKYAVPKLVRIVEQMPLTEVQKVDKKVIRAMAVEESSRL